jgi:hypothetical protein
MYNFNYECITFLYVVHVYMFCNVVLYCIALPARVLFAIKIILYIIIILYTIPISDDIRVICQSRRYQWGNQIPELKEVFVLIRQ